MSRAKKKQPWVKPKPDSTALPDATRQAIEAGFVGAVQKDLSMLRDAMQHNFSVFLQGFHRTDNTAVVTRKVMDDMVNGTVKKKTVIEVDGVVTQKVDWEAYTQEFWAHMVVTDFLVWCGRQASSSEPATIEEPKEPVDFVFGGS